MNFVYKDQGIYILQNTIGWGGGWDGCLRNKNEKKLVKRGKGENCIKNGIKGLKIASFFVVKLGTLRLCLAQRIF